MFRASDTGWAPWYVANTDDKKRGRLNVISHLLSVIPYTPAVPREVKLPKRQARGGYVEAELRRMGIPTQY